MKKKIIIFGATSGIGNEILKLFEKDSQSECYSISSSQSKKKNHMQVDLSDPKKTSSFIKKRFNKKSIYTLVFAQRYRGPSFETQLNVGLISVLAILKEFELKFKKGSSVTFLLSQASKSVLNNHDIAYHIVHSALKNLVKFYAVKFGKKQVRVNGVSTATIKKNTNRNYFNKKNNLTNFLKKLSPLNTIGDAKDVANCIYFLSNKGANYITGQTIAVDGGVDLLTNEALGKKIANLK
jgi:enoyl-[acyl-carrier-protein] reductase (NADH)